MCYPRTGLVLAALDFGWGSEPMSLANVTDDDNHAEAVIAAHAGEHRSDATGGQIARLIAPARRPGAA